MSVKMDYDRDVSLLIEKLEEAKIKIKNLYHFIEMTEALTADPGTAKRIERFLIEEGIWTPLKKTKN